MPGFDRIRENITFLLGARSWNSDESSRRFYLLLLTLFFGAAAVLVGGTALSSSRNLPGGQASMRLWSPGICHPGGYPFGWQFIACLTVAQRETVESLTQSGALGEVRISFKAIENLVLKLPAPSRGA